jgi:uracil DNA glycosylase superfamily protein
MNPYTDAHVRGYVRAFLDKYFSDTEKRVLVFGINPGRFGAGITGITFTDPVALAKDCGIENDLPRRQEISSIFIYKVIERYGGTHEFYRRVFLTAVSPLGFTRNGNNLNYYDDPALARAVTPFVTDTIEQQIALGGRRDRAIVLGIGKNARFLQQLNEKHGFFQKIDALEHPRWIMQYRRRQLEQYLAKYEEALA